MSSQLFIDIYNLKLQECNSLSATMYDNADRHTNDGYEYVSSRHNQATKKLVNTVLPPKISKPDCYEHMLFLESQTVSIDYAKNVAHWQKKSKGKDFVAHCNPYEEATATIETIYEDPGTSKEKIYAYFERKKFRKISAGDLR